MAAAFPAQPAGKHHQIPRAELRVGVEEAEARFLLIISFRIS